MLKGLKIFNIILSIFLLISIGYFLGKKYDLMLDQDNHVMVIEQSTNEAKLKKLFNIVDNEYFKHIDSDSLMDETITHVLQGLDPHSTYLNAALNQNIEKEITGNYTGLGVEINLNNDTLVIIRTIPNSPNRNQLFPGDKILKINDIDVTNKNNDLFPKLIKTRKEHTVNLIRNEQRIDVTVSKSVIEYNSVESDYMIKPKVGYIKLSRFSENTSSEIHKSLKNLNTLGMETLIFDLRDNSGGLLKEAIKVADEFIKKGETIVYLKNDKEDHKEYFKASSYGVFEDNKIYVLINENSASASEVVSGALQDNDIAVLVGRRTFGKGLVQKEIKMGGGTKIRITTAKYYTPTGRCIQKDFRENEDYSHELLNRYDSGEMYDGSKMHKIDSLKKVTPKGKVVYGGGGIMPDVFVPLQQLNFGETFYTQKGIELTNQFVMKKVSQDISKYYSYSRSQFLNNYTITNLYKELTYSFKKKNIVLDEEQQALIKVYLKAYLGKILFGEDIFYEIWNVKDPIINKTLSLIK